MLLLYERTLGTPAGFFQERFKGAHINLRLSHYPRNCKPRTIRSASHPTPEWIAAPPMPRTYLVNTRDILHQWTNKRFRSTPHRAINRASTDRYDIPFFYDPSTDVTIQSLPGGTGNPPRYPPRTFGEYYAWFVRMNYRHQADP